MASNPKDSPWYSTPRDKRKRKTLGITLSDAARDRLEFLAARTGKSRSEIIEALILGTQK